MQTRSAPLNFGQDNYYGDLYCNFPNSTFFMKKEGTIIPVNGQNFYLSKVFREKYEQAFERYTVFFEGQLAASNDAKGETVILRIRNKLTTFNIELWSHFE